MDYLGNSYSCLSSEQQSHVYQELLKRCHSLDVLRQERVILPNEPLPPGTPTNPSIKIRQYMKSPKHHESIAKRRAVVIACEYGIAESLRNEPLAICIMDCLTGETLITSLVAITQPMLDWRSDIHGIGCAQMNAAIASGQCLPGWKEAREKLFDYIDEETILVGYAIRLPLQLLRVFHAKIIDPQVLATAAIFPKRKPLLAKGRYKSRLPLICKDFLGITLRQGLHWAVGIHDRVENALAAREIALKCIQKPAELENWAQQRRTDFWGTNPTARTVLYDTSYSEQTRTGSLPTQTPTSSASNDKYEAGYKAGFESGFRMGYERGLEKANERQNHMSKTEKNDLGELQCNYQPSTQKLLSFSDDESNSGVPNETASPDEHGETSAAEIGGLLAQLMKDHKIRDMIQRGNLD
ncbi:hypothetical protein CCMA1212_008165 [Trichoderma ghanense]|uniref:Exonuclease domain-containing protein n=1 Tax=Trichoderma ghanense TaxID=65468 RepID=A0ABY2GW73_9HYPO